MIVMDTATQANSAPSLLHPTFRSWQRDTHMAGLPHVIGISGTRGKSTVLRLLEAMLNDSHLRCATWTDLGVQIRGRRQRGELSGWTHALTRLSEGSLDVALQELDWATVNAAGLPDGSYPVVALTGIRERTDSSDHASSLNPALRAARRVAAAVSHTGFMVVNSDDYYAASAAADTDATVIHAALSHLSPNLLQHIEQGGYGVWIRDGSVLMGDQYRVVPVCHVRDIPLAMHGDASFNVTNALIAIGLASGLGIDLPCIIRTLRTFRATSEILPGSMNIYENEDYRAAIDQLGPAWVLRPVLKAVNPMGARRQVTVVGNLDWIDADDIREVGRLLGRYHGAIVLHSVENEPLVDRFRHGIMSNPYPPLFIRLPTERRAITRAIKSLKPDDVLLILTGGDSSAAHRAVRRHIR